MVGSRGAAIGAAVCVLTGTAAVVLAVVAGPGPGLTGYVSEAGVAGSGYAWTYRIGVFALGAALLLLATALRDQPPGQGQPPVRGDGALRAAVALLVAGGLATALSGAVTCSAGCPLPPFETATVADLVHGAASVAATAAVVFAMIAIVLSGAAASRLRRTATITAAVALPLAGAVGLAMLLVGRGSLVGVLERLLLMVAAVWGVVTALILAAGPQLPRKPYASRR
ncbi:DUF998 domain-containing protein [Micromonospora zingiberis]|uniref:DUF998 domain-containing protein n=1 Tax=Micromonospora zingiberis TaxID=2053011 RepID=A0A4R0GJ53_9ACTN|nr:DUF998 domain-containing protein [Micromonospora zingiberis]